MTFTTMASFTRTPADSRIKPGKLTATFGNGMPRDFAPVSCFIGWNGCTSSRLHMMPRPSTPTHLSLNPTVSAQFFRSGYLELMPITDHRSPITLCRSRMFVIRHSSFAIRPLEATVTLSSHIHCLRIRRCSYCFANKRPKSGSRNSRGSPSTVGWSSLMSIRITRRSPTGRQECLANFR